ncbi:hypothetical protein AMJ52_06970 [candidate division TA06 bacterium DG_78]|uniref:Peptidase M1 membrane alanine aminopeptidase domain-containing protein n=1 Tax=candidate division TA06 bacterium DG_78 TaxID=1703772 RepID=A0A0S7YC28_UNCT6|nr:MAG: hypothetical protein AMJ52_06970 [candidate division TA06 bacterium DG_78]
MTVCILIFLLQWQQRVAYNITGYLDTEEKSLRAVEYLTYFNNSPYPLETFYIHLYANAYRDTTTVYAQEIKKLHPFVNSDFLRSKESERGYIDINSVKYEGKLIEFKIDETIMTIFLSKPVVSGDSIVLEFDFYLKIPKQFSRLGYQNNHYEMTQWYPKVCVFDDDAWHREPYHALGEFYGEFGSFDVEIDLPGDYVVAATGERINEADREFMDALIDGRRIDMGERKTVRFIAENVHDFAWVCDPDFLVKKYEADSVMIWVYYLQQFDKNWEHAGAYAVDAVKRYDQWYGMYPYKNLSVVSGYHPSGEGMEYPNLIIVCIGEDRFTRFFEETIIHEIGHQWFYGALGSNEIDETWLDEGFTSYSEIRYFEDKYGEKNSLHKLSFLSPLSVRYYRTLLYYVTQTNELEKPILTPAYDFIDTPIAYISSAYAKPALFLFHLEGILGRAIFDKIIKRYVREYTFKHPRTEDFIRICEEESGQELQSLFHSFLYTTDFCDWAVQNVSGNRVEIENRGDFFMPVDIVITTESTEDTLRIDTQQKFHTIIVPGATKIKRVIIDPYQYSFESNYWNNHYPRKLEFKPIIDVPSFDSYQIFYLPYLWYSTYDGITIGAYLLGTEFADIDFIKGRHQWTAGCIYGFKSKNFYPVFSYQTPIIFKRGMRTRLVLQGSNSSDEYNFGLGFTNNFGIPFSQSPEIALNTMLSFYKLNSYDLVDSIDWEFGRNIVSENHVGYQHHGWNIDICLSLAHKIIGSEWKYVKTTIEIKNDIETFIPVSLRIFAGRIFGSAPTQEQFFLSGALRISLLADLLFNQRGYFSPQEHLHVAGDGNMLGYQTMHIKSNEMYCLGIELPAKFPIRIFADIGYCREYVADFGAKVVLGPISFNFPFYTRTNEPWKLRWSIGL